VIIDGRLRVPLGARVLTKEAAKGTLLVTTMRTSRKLTTLRRRGATIWTVRGRRGVVSLRPVLTQLARRGVNSVVIEGGATLAASALRERVVDRCLFFVAPKLIGGDGRPMVGELGVAAIGDAYPVAVRGVSRLGADLLIEAVPGGAR
jgi:diaminohydroxyphosphoribosylaminopyrimidine deaminase/5-amino-6-(5-phosphoribosylamino)uracil reductase